MRPDSRKHLVLGAAIGYTAEQIEPFLTSLRQTSYDGDVALLVDPRLAGRFAAMPLFRDVILLRAAQWIPFRRGWVRGDGVFTTRRWWPIHTLLWIWMRALNFLPVPAALRLRLQAMPACLLFPPSVSRYFHYHAFVRSSGHERVLISDVRDVLFQDDPFASLPRAGLAVGLETPRLALGAEPWNAKWLREAYGEDTLRRLADRPIACSGVTYGDRASMQAYLKAMLLEFTHLGSDACATSAIDQGVHNYLLWAGKLPQAHHLITLRSTLATLALVEEGELRFDAHGRLVNLDGSAISLVHQYDRWPAVFRR